MRPRKNSTDSFASFFNQPQLSPDELQAFFKEHDKPNTSDDTVREKVKSFFVENFDLSELKKLFPDRELTSFRVKLSRKPDLIFPNKGVMSREHFSVKLKFKDHTSEVVRCHTDYKPVSGPRK